MSSDLESAKAASRDVQGITWWYLQVSVCAKLIECGLLRAMRNTIPINMSKASSIVGCDDTIG